MPATLAPDRFATVDTMVAAHLEVLRASHPGNPSHARLTAGMADDLAQRIGTHEAYALATRAARAAARCNTRFLACDRVGSRNAQREVEGIAEVLRAALVAKTAMMVAA